MARLSKVRRVELWGASRQRLTLFAGLSATLALGLACGSDGSSGAKRHDAEGRDGGVQPVRDGGPAKGAPLDGADGDSSLSDARAPLSGASWEAGERLGPLAMVEYATLEVPVDYTDPEGDKLPLALARLRSQHPERNGVLLFNPGGPGEGMVDQAAAYLRDFSVLFPTKDVVLMDNRGTGRSAPLECLELDDLLSLEAELEEDAETPEGRLEGTAAVAAAIEEGCLARFGEHLPYFNTENVARDMESVRIALGEGKLDFWGASYGTLQGALYASMFPERVGSWVLEAPVVRLSKGLDYADIAFQGARAYEAQLDRFLAWCDDNCDPEVLARGGAATVYDALAEELEAGVEIEEGETIPADALNGGTQFLLLVGYWDLLQIVLEEAMFGNWEPLAYIAALAPGAGDDQASLNFVFSNIAIWLLDNDCRGRDLEELTERYAESAERYPRLGAGNAEGAGLCLGWKTDAAEPPMMTTDLSAPPVLVMAALHDPATPYENATTLVEQLNNGSKLLSSNNEGHGVSSTECGIIALMDYMVTGDLKAVPEECDAPPIAAAARRSPSAELDAAAEALAARMRHNRWRVPRWPFKRRAL